MRQVISSKGNEMRIRRFFILKGGKKVAVMAGLFAITLLVSAVGIYADAYGYTVLEMFCLVLCTALLGYVITGIVVEEEVTYLGTPHGAAKAAAKAIEKAKRRPK